MKNASPDQGLALGTDGSKKRQRSLSTPSTKPATRQKPKLTEPVIVAEWWKNRRGDSIRVCLNTYEGHNLVDIRSWFSGDGRLKPGKGFSCNIRHLPRLAKEIEKALTEARRLDLIAADDEVSS